MSGDLRFGAQKIVLVVVVRVLEKNCDAAAESAADYVLRRVKQPKYETPGTRPNLGGRPLCSVAALWDWQPPKAFGAGRRLPSIAQDSAVLSDAPRVNCPVNKNARHIRALGRSREPPACPEGFRRLPTCRAATLPSGSPPRFGRIPVVLGLATFSSPFAITNRSCSCPQNRRHPTPKLRGRGRLRSLRRLRLLRDRGLCASLLADLL
jgi:hypothetical protein